MGTWHDSMLRVRFEETDFMGVVYYSKFFNWLEVGRVNLFRHLGIDLREIAQSGFHIPVVQAHADYRASARFDDEVLVRTRIAKVGNSSIRFENEVYRLPEKTLLCTGHTVHVLTNNLGKPVRFSADLRKKLTSF
ncbi:MAG TPA: thioesterase family protein [Nitrososphaerales archaeon]|nr:thioesterase family protein [Nitrososphaerales archaeon]